MARDVQRILQMAQPVQSAGIEAHQAPITLAYLGAARKSIVREPPHRFFHSMVRMFML